MQIPDAKPTSLQHTKREDSGDILASQDTAIYRVTGKPGLYRRVKRTGAGLKTSVKDGVVAAITRATETGDEQVLREFQRDRSLEKEVIEHLKNTDTLGHEAAHVLALYISRHNHVGLEHWMEPLASIMVECGCDDAIAKDAAEQWMFRTFGPRLEFPREGESDAQEEADEEEESTEEASDETEPASN